VADVSVRPAAVTDAAEIARLQTQTWQLAYRDVLPVQVLDSLDPAQFEAAWHQAIVAPPSEQHRVLIATEGENRVGFAAFGPDADRLEADPEPEHTAAISALLVEPRWARRGHGSRLLAAIADLAAADGMRRLVAWVATGDFASLEFYRSAGWDADGAQRGLDTGAGTVAELRLHTTLVD